MLSSTMGAFVTPVLQRTCANLSISRPLLNPNVTKITGVICGYRVEDIEDELMRKIRYLDKLVDELAKGKAMEKILRK